MKSFRLKAHTGPCVVKTIACHLRSIEAFSDVVQGTETVYWVFQADDDVSAVIGSLNIMKRELDTTFGVLPTVLHEVEMVSA